MQSPAEPPDLVGALAAAVLAGDAARVRQLVQTNPELRATLDDPMPGASFDGTALLTAVWRGNRDLVEALLEGGADINARSHWWAGGFGVLDHDGDLVPFLIARGATIDAHAAARMGRLDKLHELISADPALVHARGGDGQTPLHFAATVEAAAYLLDHGADIDARDIDHESTPAQYMVRDRQGVARYLVRRGCRTDILMAAALGDADLVRQHLDRDAACIRMTVSERYFPKLDPRSGGAIYIWTLGANRGAHMIASELGHEDVFRLLMERSPADLQLAVACEQGNESAVGALLAANPDLAKSLSDEERRRLPDAAQSNNLNAVRLMLKSGWPVDARGQHRGTALHWAAFHGSAKMVRELLDHHAPVEVKGDEYDATPLGWALHGSVHGWNRRTGDYADTVAILLAAGAQAPPPSENVETTDAVRAVLLQRL